MNAFEAFELFMALKLHFTKEDYDFFKYEGRVNVAVSTFTRRVDVFRFEKLSKHKDPLGYLLANFASHSLSWIGDIGSETCDEVYTDWMKRRESLSYTFKQDLAKFDPVFNNNIKLINGDMPKAVILFRRQEICIETMVILDILVNCVKYWDKNIEDPLIWPSLSFKIKRYEAFFDLNKIKYRNIVLAHFTQ